MLNVNFNLRKQESKKPQIVYLVLRWDGNYYRYTTKYNVLPSRWDVQKQAFKLEREKKTALNVVDVELKEANRLIAEKNVYLAKMKKAVLDEYERATATQVIITKDYFKTFLDRWTRRKVDEKPNFWRFVNNYIDTSSTRINPKTGRTISSRTIQEYNTTKSLLQAFEKENGETIDFDNISLSTLSDFRDYLTTVATYKVKDKVTKEVAHQHYKLNNIAKHIDNLKQFLRAAAASKIQFDFDVIDNKKFYNAREAAHDVYLNETELQLIEALDLSHNIRLDKARDLFLIGCYTGQRVSDYNNIKAHHIKGSLIELYQQKTGKPVKIPIHTTVKSILAKYNGYPPPKISDQKLNMYIKEVCQLAGIKEQTEKQGTRGGAKVVSVTEKWQLVSSHTARRSFASNMVRRGLPMRTIMALTGHEKENTFLKYVKLSAHEHAEIAAKHWQDYKSVNVMA